MEWSLPPCQPPCTASSQAFSVPCPRRTAGTLKNLPGPRDPKRMNASAAQQPRPHSRGIL